MSNDLNQIQSEEPAKEGRGISIKELTWLCLSKWYWFVIALVLCLGYAYYYIQKTPKVYVAEMEVLVNDNTGDSPDVSMAFSDIALLGNKQNINNEMVMLKSPVVVEEVVRRLGLDVDYNVQDGLRKRVLYGKQLPVIVDFITSNEDEHARFNLKYNGDGMIEIGPFTLEDEDFEDLDTNENISFELKAVMNDTIQTPVGAIRVIENPDFVGNKEEALVIEIDHVGIPAAIARVSANLKTEVQDNYSSVIQVYFNDINVERALATLNTIYQIYQENWVQHRNEISLKTSEFINDRLDVIELELASVDNQISDIETTSPVIPAEQTAEHQRSIEIRNQISSEEALLGLAQQVRSHLNNVATRYELLPGATGLGSDGVDSRIAQYNELLSDYKDKLYKSSDDNPVVRSLKDDIDRKRQEIITALDADIARRNVTISAMRRQLGEAEARKSAAPTQAKKLLEPERRQKVKESLYLYLLQKREENELSQAFSAYNTQLVSPPTISGPVSPKEQQIYLIAFAAGLLIPGGLIFLREYFNTRVRGRKDLESLSIPFVGEIPMASRKKPFFARLFSKNKYRSHERIVVERGNNDYVNEAFRVIRTNLDFMTGETESEKGSVLMFTSANPGSGKTFLSSNLAAVLGLKGKKIALVDLDLRKASLSKLVGSGAMGMSNLLAGSSSVEEIVVRDINGHEGVDLYPAGPLPPNPAELLYSHRLEQFINQLKGEYDYVILDCPPAEVVADAKIINKYADLTLFIIRAGLLERDMLAEIQRFYDRKRYKNMSIILNGTEPQGSSYISRGNRFSYGYGYGYGYGYVGSGKKKKK